MCKKKISRSRELQKRGLGGKKLEMVQIAQKERIETVKFDIYRQKKQYN